MWFHDVTEQKQAQALLMEQQRALAMLQERDRVARELHDSLGQVLGYVKMQAQAARERLAQDQKQIVAVEGKGAFGIPPGVVAEGTGIDCAVGNEDVVVDVRVRAT